MRKSEEIAAFVQSALKTDRKDALVYARITERERAVIQAYTDIDAEGFEHIMEADRVRHIFKEHSKKTTEELRGNIPLSVQDFILLPTIIQNYDSIDLVEESSFGQKRVMYTKVVGGTIYCVVEVRKKKKTLSLITLYKTKKERK